MMQGLLQDISVADLVHDAAGSGFSGSIEIEDSGGGGAIYLNEGRIYWARPAGLADVVGIVDQLQLGDEAAKRVKAHMAAGLTLVSSLERLDWMDRDALRRVVREQTERTCRRLATVSQGRFQLTPNVQSRLGIVSTWPVEAFFAVTAAGPGRQQRPEEDPTPGVRLAAVEWQVVNALVRHDAAPEAASRTGLPVHLVESAIRRIRAAGPDGVLADPGDAGWIEPGRAAASLLRSAADPGTAAPAPEDKLLTAPRDRPLPPSRLGAELALPRLLPAEPAGARAKPPAAHTHAGLLSGEQAGGPATALAPPAEQQAGALRRLILAVRKI